MEQIADTLTNNFLSILRNSLNTNENAQNPPTPSNRIDIVELEERYLIMVELPGVDPDTLNVNFTNRNLSVSGRKKNPYEDENVIEYIRQERVYGYFYSSVAIPTSISESAQVEENVFENGVLYIKIRKNRTL